MNRADGSIFNTDSIQMRVDYDVRTDGQPLYVGYAARGIASSQKGWLIQKFTYTTIGGADYVSYRSISTDIWDNRATATYS